MKIDEEIKCKFTSSMSRAVVNVRYTSNILAARQQKFMIQFDLSMPQFNILRILRGAKKLESVNTVKDLMVEKSPNTTRLMDKLIEKELIQRERCESDRRIVYVKISPLGLKLLDKIDLSFDDQKNNKQMFSGNLTDKEADLLSNLLDKLRLQE